MRKKNLLDVLNIRKKDRDTENTLLLAALLYMAAPLAASPFGVLTPVEEILCVLVGFIGFVIAILVIASPWGKAVKTALQFADFLGRAIIALPLVLLWHGASKVPAFYKQKYKMWVRLERSRD